jgi:hypothetical protein
VANGLRCRAEIYLGSKAKLNIDIRKAEIPIEQ